MLNDQALKQAASKIKQRSERQEDLQKLLSTYVDIGILPQLQNNNHQIVYGRRGTGKTHVLKVLAAQLKEQNKHCVVYIDARVLGSTSQFSDHSLPIRQRCLSLFRDILLEIYNGLLEHVVYTPPKYADLALAAMDELSSVATEPEIITTQRETNVETSETAKNERRVGLKISPNISASSAAASAQYEGQSTVRHATSATQIADDKVVFPGLNRQLSKTLELAECDLFVLIDEWSSLPKDVQPYLAEFLKRGLLPIQKATIKIAALEQRSTFFIREQNGLTGFELGADISSAIDLDDYYVFDRNPEQIANFYGDIIFQHLASELPQDHLENVLGARTGKELQSKLFTQREIFKELARASEGVIRDLINIFTQAFFSAARRGRENIDKRAVLDGARAWFEQDKSQALDPGLKKVLRKIVDDVIGVKRARSFMLPGELEKHPVVERLFDARVLHQMQRGYADKDNPGARYNIYSLDYGTYVDLIDTNRQPEIDLLDDNAIPQDDRKDIVVPFDDKRSIRRIVLTAEHLDHAHD